MIVKVGGSVADEMEKVAEVLKNKAVAIVPGGWKFADLVREVDAEMKLPPSISHWMAIASMDVYGHYISNFGIDAFEPESIEDCRVKEARVLLLHHLLFKLEKSGELDLPHSWDVTSDSIAIWLAAKLGYTTVVKVTKLGGVFVDGKLVEEISASENEKLSEIVDRFSPKLLEKYRLNMFVCGVEEIKSYIHRGRARGTLIRGGD